MLIALCGAYISVIVGCISTSQAGADPGLTLGNAERESNASPGVDVTPSRLASITDGWKTDFGRLSVPISEIQSGGPTRDGIPPIDAPQFVSNQDARIWLKLHEPVVTLEVNGEARAYPLQILVWHEIVNDTVGGRPVSLTYCPLCNLAIAFDREIDGETYNFGTTGYLRQSNLVMWDRQTESWWQQSTGEAIVGARTGTRLAVYPSAIASFEDFQSTYPRGAVLSRDTGFIRGYGRNPYPGYDDVRASPFLFSGSIDERLKSLQRVATVNVGHDSTAYPFTELENVSVVQDTVAGQDLVVLFARGTRSALDRGEMADSRDVGATGVFRPSVGGRTLSFLARGGAIFDAETDSQWNVLGHAVAGALVGSRLEPITHGNHFWFCWVAFQPSTRVWTR
ncbi:MAG: DUF3179 domain-containing protein [Chloroflexota bacterium]